MSSNKEKETPADIIREQIELLKTEKELTAMLEKINEHYNQLLVSTEGLFAKLDHTIWVRCL